MASRAVQNRSARRDIHVSFLRAQGWRWARVAALLVLISLFLFLVDPAPRPNGGTAFGYASGTVATLIILWLTALGIRKRAMTRGRWSLKNWTSAHVWLGASLSAVVTLHSAFDFGWNVHTLAYVLMMLVIASGVWGVVAYATLPKALSDNRGETTEPQMLESLRSIDRQLHDAAQPLDAEQAGLVRESLDEDPFGGGVFARLSGHYPRCRTVRARELIREQKGTNIDAGALERVEALLGKKAALLTRVRRHLRIKASLEVWLYVHVPLTFATIAALVAHIVSVFFYW